MWMWCLEAPLHLSNRVWCLWLWQFGLQLPIFLFEYFETLPKRWSAKRRNCSAYSCFWYAFRGSVFPSTRIILSALVWLRLKMSIVFASHDVLQYDEKHLCGDGKSFDIFGNRSGSVISFENLTRTVLIWWMLRRPGNNQCLFSKYNCFFGWVTLDKKCAFSVFKATTAYSILACVSDALIL